MNTHAPTRFTTDQMAALQCVLHLLKFLSPLLCIVGLLEFSLWRTGDNWPTWLAYRTQQASPVEIPYDRDFFSEQLGVYKLIGIREQQPKFLVVGSSRVLQIRNVCFAPHQHEFYNAGGVLQNMADLLRFVELLKNEELPRPRWLLVGIDPWWLKEELKPSNSWLAEGEEVYQPVAHVEALRRAIKRGRWQDLLAGLQLRELKHNGQPVLGGLAWREGSGFRRDGSRQSPVATLQSFLNNPVYEDRELPPVIDRIQNHWSQFSLPAKYDQEKARHMLEALAKLHALGIETWVFLPPFATECVAALEKDPQLQEWWEAYCEELPKTLEKAGLHVLRIFTPADAGLSDVYLLDGFHPSEVFMSQLMIQMQSTAPTTSLLQSLDHTALREKIRNARTPLSFD